MPIRDSKTPFFGFAARRVAVSLFALCVAQSALAQNTEQADVPAAGATPASSPTGGADIVVTARNKAERLQDVPLAINVVSGDTLVRQGIRDLRDVSYKVPGLVINGGGAETLVRPSLRGLPTSEADPTVAIFFDSSYLGGSYANNVSMLDLERIEVVKGPVNTLYGRPGYAGAINYVSKMPGNDTDGRVYMQTGNDKQIKGGFAFGFTAIPDVLMFRVAAAHDGYGGGYKDKVNGLTAGGFRKDDAQVSMLFKPTDRLSFFGRAYYGHDDFDTSPQTYNDNNCGPVNTTSAYATIFPHQSFFCGKFDPTQHAIEVSPQASMQTANSRRVWNLVGRLNYDTGFGDLSATTTRVATDLDRFIDFYGRRTGVPYIIVDSASTGATGTGLGTQVGVQNLLGSFGTKDKTRDFSQELRFTSEQNHPLRFALGGYYAKTTSYTANVTGIDGSALAAGTTIRGGTGTGGGTTPLGAPFNYLRDFLAADGTSFSSAVTAADSGTKIWSGFIGTEYDIFPTLTVGVEGRYADLQRSITQLSANSRNTLVYPLSRATSFKDWTGRGTVRWKVTPDAMLYATVANGVKPGGFNARATTEIDLVFGREKNLTYEAGFKTSLLDHKLVLNGSVYLIDIKDIQGTGPARDPSNNALVTSNIGTARSKGFELDTQIRPTSWLTFDAGVGYADIAYRNGTYDFTFAATCAAIGAAFCDQSRITTITTVQGTTRTVYLLDGLRPIGSSKWTFSGSTSIDVPVTEDVKVFGDVKYRYQGKQFANNQNISWWGALNRVDARLGVEQGPIRLTAFVDNLTQNKTPESVAPSTYLNDLSSGYFGQLPVRRRYGLGLEYRF